MSETETHRGKLVPMSLKGATLEERAKDACQRFGYERTDYHDTWLECLEDEGYRHLHVRGDIIYEAKDTRLEDYEFVEGTKNDDGSYDYFFAYYNGGASFDEMLDTMMKKADKK